ncbi:MAG: helix-turn-helix domain-containing protein [Candidatus Woesearchaeota archaeon]
MTKYFIVKEQDNRFFYDDLFMLQNPASLKLTEDGTRIKILKMLSLQPMYPAEIAKKLHMHEQKVYYHVKQLLNSDIIELTEKKEIRGTMAKKYSARQMNFAVSLSANWKNIKQLLGSEKDKRLELFLKPFIENDELNAKIIVGSPDPHGQFKARARDGHYAVDLALFLGAFCSSTNHFSVKLDVDTDLKHEKTNFIIVGGPVTNLAMAKINDFLPAKFSDSKPWGIVGKEEYTDDSIGLIAKIPNPYNPASKIIALAGIRFSGTKAAVIGFSRFTRQVLSRFADQKEFCCIVQGFDLDGDGSIDSVEVLESY